MFKCLLLPLFLMILLASCKKNNKPNIKKITVEIQHYDKNNLVKTELTNLTTRLTKESKIQLLGVEKNNDGEITIDKSIEIFNNDISRIKINGYISDLITDKNFIIDNKNYNVKKYYYDVPEVIDEESYIFLHNNRMICCSSKVWNSFKFYKYDETNFYQKFINDSDDFFNHSKEKPTHNTI